MIVKNYTTGKYTIIKKTNIQDYYLQIILQQYNVNLFIPKMNQVKMIQNIIQAKYN